jgi:hypothetical protein
LIGKTFPTGTKKGNKAINWWKFCENVQTKRTKSLQTKKKSSSNNKEVRKCSNLDFTNSMIENDDRAELILLMIHNKKIQIFVTIIFQPKFTFQPQFGDRKPRILGANFKVFAVKQKGMYSGNFGAAFLVIVGMSTTLDSGSQCLLHKSKVIHFSGGVNSKATEKRFMHSTQVAKLSWSMTIS